MDRKIGDVFWLILFIGIISLGAQDVSITLVALDKKGRAVQRIQVGVPFFLKVSVSGKERRLPQPTVTNLDSSFIKGQSTSQSMQSINGAMAVTNDYVYTMAIDREGTFSCGPAIAQYQGQQIESNSLTLVAEQRTTVDMNESQDVFATFSVNKNTVYCHEPIECTVRFYYAVDGVKLQEVTEPTFADCVVEKTSQPRSGTEIIKDLQYRYIEWKKTIYPSRTGVLDLNPIGMVYVEPTRNRSMMGGSMFSDIFDMMTDMNRMQEIFTNGCKIEVKSLPPHDPATDAIGNFKNFSAHLSTTSGTVGEGNVLQLEVVGEGNLFVVSHPRLTLPYGLSCYEGNSSYDESSRPLRKVFEYVIQASHPGVYTIEPQTFYYFDSFAKTYKKLSTQPITLTITGESLKKNYIDDQHIIAKNGDKQGDIHFYEYGPLHKRERYYIPWLFFFSFITLQVFVIIGISVFRIYKKKYENGKKARQYALAFKNARHQIELARKNKYYGYLYHIFIQLFVDRCRVDSQIITEEYIENLLKLHVTPSELVQWRLFYVTTSEYAFTDRSHYSDMVFTQALQWLYKWEKII